MRAQPPNRTGREDLQSGTGPEFQRRHRLSPVPNGRSAAFRQNPRAASVATNRLPSRAPDDSLRLSARQNFSDDSASIPATAVLRRHLEPMAITCRSLRARGARRLSACAEMRGRARSARYDVAIYAPGSAQVYVEGAAAAGGAERQLMLLARELARRGVTVCHVVEHVDAVDTDQDGVRLVIQRPEVPRMLPGGMIGRTWDALKRADAEIYLQRSVGFATFLVGA